MTDHAPIRPQPGPQTAFLASPADIAIYGGAAFGGKSYAILLDPTRHVHIKGYNALIFRRTTRQIRDPGGLWDTSHEIYPRIAGDPKLGLLRWRFPGGGAIGFAHLEHEASKYDYQGAQIAMIGFDELTHFSEGQFWYMLSRNRSMTRVRPYTRATCNPDPDSFVRRLVDWWIGDDGLPIPARSGVLRWFVRPHDELIWADTPEALTALHPGKTPKSLTFIGATSDDNRLGMDADPDYLATLDVMPRVERERLRTGNWDIRPVAGDYFRRDDFAIIAAAPPARARIRYWDRAATEPSSANPDPDYTVGLLMSVDGDGHYTVEHVDRFRARPGDVRRRIINTATQDGRQTWVGLEQDPGQAGKFEADSYVRDKALAGYQIKVLLPQGDKETRATPVSAASTNGTVRLLRGGWNEAFFQELENFPEGRYKDQVDALSGAYNALTGGLLPLPAGATIEPPSHAATGASMRADDPYWPQHMRQKDLHIRVYGGWQ